MHWRLAAIAALVGHGHWLEPICKCTQASEYYCSMHCSCLAEMSMPPAVTSLLVAVRTFRQPLNNERMRERVSE